MFYAVIYHGQNPVSDENGDAGTDATIDAAAEQLAEDLSAQRARRHRAPRRR